MVETVVILATYANEKDEKNKVKNIRTKMIESSKKKFFRTFAVVLILKFGFAETIKLSCDSVGSRF